MKKLVVSALFASVFFIGISGLINGVSAKLGSDEKALELVRASRIALGGNQNLTAVRSLSIKATTTHMFEKAGVQDIKQGNLEINLEFPGKFAKKVMIGTPGDGDADAIVEKDVDVIVRSGSGAPPADGENVFFIKKGDGKTVEWTSGEDSAVKVDGDKVFIKKDDGTVEELKTDGKHKMIVRTNKDGAAGDENVWTNKDGKQIRIEKDAAFTGSHESSEMLRMTMGLLMTAPEDGSVTYKFLGQGSVDGFPSNIIGVESNGGSFKLFLDAGSNLPQMISYQGHGPHRIMIREGNKVVQDNIVGPEFTGKAESLEKQIKFSDFRSVGSILLPYRWTETAGGKTTQNIDVTSYEINPADIAERFGSDGEGSGKRVVVKKMKP